MARKNTPNQTINTESSASLLGISIRIAFKRYETIGWLFLFPWLLVYLGFTYYGKLQTVNNTIKFTPGSNEVLGLILIILGMLVMIINYVPSLKFRLDAADGKPIQNIFQYYRLDLKLYLRVWSVQIVSYVSYAIGFVLLIVPGLIVFPRIVLSPYYALEDPQASIQSLLRKSWQQTKPYYMSIYAIYAIMVLVGMVPSLLFGQVATLSIIFILLSYITMFMPALLYREIASIKR